MIAPVLFGFIIGLHSPWPLASGYVVAAALMLGERRAGGESGGKDAPFSKGEPYYYPYTRLIEPQSHADSFQSSDVLPN